MKTSNFLIATLRESPAEAEIVSHQLMLRAALIRKLASGLYTWLPLGFRVLKKVETIVREEMERIGAQEILMPAIQPKELWEETHRWEQFGPQLLKISDRHERFFCFGPTHEEVITDLVRRELKSYKQVPVTFFQIQTKFRDEIRPRFGVMRAREFLMKDAYSFHIDERSLQETYDKFYQAYTRIFTRLGLRFRPVLADSGNIGGKVSHEFHVLADSGEDILVYSDKSPYAANVEFAQALPPQGNRPQGHEELRLVSTPDIRTVEGQAVHLGVKPDKILKTLIVKGVDEKTPFVALLVRGDHDLNPCKAEKHPLVSTPLTFATPEELLLLTKTTPGFVGPKDLAVPLIADHCAAHMFDFICGANQEDHHWAGFNWDRDATLQEITDLRFVQTGDPSPDGQGSLHFTRGIEVGHIFQLGTKYSEAMNTTLLNQQGQKQVLTMGCYGIGISRIVAAAIEQNYDERGILWPGAMAPFQVVLIPIQFYRSPLVQEKTESLYHQLIDMGIEVILDDRDERLGVMLADAELIGYSHLVIISEKTLQNETVEYRSRQETLSHQIPLESIADTLYEKVHQNPIDDLSEL